MSAFKGVFLSSIVFFMFIFDIVFFLQVLVLFISKQTHSYGLNSLLVCRRTGVDVGCIYVRKYYTSA